jgi:hypothetical protein
MRLNEKLALSSVVPLLLTLGGCSPDLPPPEPVVTLDGLLTTTRPAQLRRPADQPPPLTGGTVLVTRDNRFAVVSEPDADRIYLVDLEPSASPRVRPLSVGSQAEPGRCTEGESGSVHCLMRGSGEVLTIDLAGGTVQERRTVCAEPRSIVAHPALGLSLVSVVCASGDLITLEEEGLRPHSVLRLGVNDLYDALWIGGGFWITRYRSAELLQVDVTGHISQRVNPPEYQTRTSAGIARYGAQVGRRLISAPAAGGALMVFQYETLQPLAPSRWAPPCTDPRECPPLLPTALKVGSDFRLGARFPLKDVVLTTDLAVSRDGKRFAAVDAANIPMPGTGERPQGSPLYVGVLDASGTPKGELTPVSMPEGASAVSIAPYRTSGFLVQGRRPRSLFILEPGKDKLVEIPLDPISQPLNIGFELFHRAAPLKVACASCHAEAEDDGHVWFRTFNAGPEPRRTLAVRGRLRESAPFRWDGEHGNMSQIIAADLTAMGQDPGKVSEPMIDAMVNWLDAQPERWNPATWKSQQALLPQGQSVYLARCESCHGGSQRTIATSKPVSEGMPALQVPRLVDVGNRSPLLHDGCARDLATVFDRSCKSAGDAHDLDKPDPQGTRLSAADKEALMIYLGTL